MRKVRVAALLALIVSFLLQSIAQAEQWQRLPLANESILNANSIGGEGGQWIQALNVDPITGDFVLMVTDVGGMFRSLDGGKTFEPANVGFYPRGGSGIAIDPNNSNRVLVVGGNSVPNGQNGLYLSTNKAASWQPVYTANIEGYRDFRDQVVFDKSSYDASIGGSKIAYWSRIANDTNPWIQPTVYSALYKSVDGGVTWNEIPNSSQFGGSIIKVHPTSGVVYVANSTGFYKSENGASSFILKVSGDIKGMDVSYGSPNNVYLTKADGLYVSTNSGDSFNKITSSSFPTTNPMFLKVSPLNPLKMILCNNAMDVPNYQGDGYGDTMPYYTTDGGTTWNKSIKDTLNSFVPYNGRQSLFAWDPNEENIVWSTGGDYLMKSVNAGAKFVWASNGITGIMPGGSFSFNSNYPNLLYMNSQDYNGAVSMDGGITWKYVNPSGFDWGGWGYGAYPVNPNLLIVGTKDWQGNKEIAVSRDTGDSWTKINLGLDANGSKISLNGLETAYADPTDDHILFVHEYRSVDQGYTWYKMNNSKGVLTHNPAGSKELYGGNNNKVVRSFDKGLTWETLVTMPGNVRDVAFDHINNKIYIATDWNLHEYVISTNTLTDISNRAPVDQTGSRKFSTVAVDPVNPSVVYTGGSGNTYSTDTAVYRSTNAGTSFEVLTRNTRNSAIQNGLDGGKEANWIRVHPVTRYAYVGGQCYGMWKIGPPGDTASDTTEANLIGLAGNGRVSLDWFGNGRVSQNDVNELVANYGTTNIQSVYKYDMNGDRTINSLDRDLMDARRIEDSTQTLTEYDVYRSTSVNSGFTKIAGPITATTYLNTSLTNGTTYYFKVLNRSTNTYGQTVAVIPANEGPSAVFATEFDNKIELSWTPRATDSYRIFRSNTQGTGYALLADNITMTKYTDTQVLSGKKYYYKVVSVVNNNESSNSVERYAALRLPATQLQALPAGNPSQGTAFTENFDDGVADNWILTNAGVNNMKLNSTWDSEAMGVYNAQSYTAYNYKVDIQINGGSLFNRGGVLFNYQDSDNYYFLDVSSWANGGNEVLLKRKFDGGVSELASGYSNYDMTNSTVQLEVIYEDGGYITVKATKTGVTTVLFNRVQDQLLKGGKVGIHSNYSSVVFDNAVLTPLATTADSARPTAPVLTSVLSANGLAVNLTWTASTDNSSVAGYTIYRNGVPISRQSTLAYTDSAVLEGTSYSYKVVAYDSSYNQSNDSNTGTASTGTAPSSNNQTLFFDDFENGSSSNWTPNGGTWSVVQPAGSSKEYQKTSSGDNISLAGSSWGNYSVQGYINLMDDNGGVCLLGRVQNDQQYYQLELRKDGSGNKKWWIWKNNNGNWTEVASGSYNFSAGTYYLMKLNMNGSTLTASVSTDWGNSFQPLGSGTDSSYLSGKIGLRSWGSGGSFDVIKVIEN